MVSQYLSPKWLIIPLIVSLLIHAAGLYLFKEGFLLTRLELSTKNTCTLANSTTSNIRNNKKDSCWPPRRFERVLLIMIDALRFDFMAFDPSYTSTNTPHFINKMPVFQDILDQKHPGWHGLLFHGLADPPTTTLQRLIALTTGALPTLVDAGSNFDASAITEDNLVYQLSRQQKRIVVMGDDTWERIFPNTFDESYAYPSFDVWDLHTVDEAVIGHLFPALNKTSYDWGLMIAHFLGVDHAGHRYGPGHPAMADKLRQLNNVVTDIFGAVDNDTLVVVMGDHGMDKKGDHGGDSDPELDAGLFLFSTRPLTNPSTNEILQNAMMQFEDLLPGERFTAWKNHRSVCQIDLVPTIATMLGIPLPYGSLGTVIPELLTAYDDGFADVVRVTRRNAQQIHTYIQEYGRKRSDAAEAFSKSTVSFHIAEQCYQSVSGASDIDSLQLCFQQYLKFTRQTLLIARSIWSRFENSLIISGDIVLILGILVLALLGMKLFRAEWSVVGASPSIVTIPVLLGTLAVLGGIGSLGLIEKTFSGSIYLGDSWKPFHEILFFLSIGFIVIVFSWIMQARLSYVNNISDTKSPQTQGGELSQLGYMFGIVGTVLLFMYVACVGSDSFTIFEDFVLLYFTQFIAILLMICAFEADHDKVRLFFLALLFACITRIMHASTICRPDQGPFCTPTFNHSPQSSVADPVSVVFLGMVSAVIMAGQIVYRPSSRTPRLLQMLQIVSIILSFTYWTLDTLENHHKLEVEYRWIKFTLAKVFWILGSIELFLVVGPSSLGGSPSQGHYVLFVSWLFRNLAFFQKPMGGTMLGLAFIQIIILAELHSRWQKQGSVYHFGIQFLFMVLLFFTGQRTFFSTGHQNELVTIQYEMGFVGLQGVNWVLSPFFIGLNTFGGMLLCGLSVPLLTFWSHDHLSASSSSVTTSSSVITSTTWKHRVFFSLFVYHAIITGLAVTMTTFCAGWFQRHSQAWRVWGPKFLFTTIGLVGVEIVNLLVSLLLVIRIVAGNDTTSESKGKRE